MAQRNFYPGYKYGRERVDLEFTFTAPGAGTSVASTAIEDDGKAIASITHSAGTAILAVTMKDPFNKVMHATADVHATSGKRATIDTFANEGTGTPLTFNIRTWVAAGTVDNDNADRITVRLTLRNTKP